MIDLNEKCLWLRREIFRILMNSKRGHIGGSLSCVEILVALYYGDILNLKKDKFILSKGHVSMALYPILYDIGLIDNSLYNSCYLNGSSLGGHPDASIPGIEIGTGSLGHGPGVAAGMSLSDRIDNINDRFLYVLIGDGECCEGSIWESLLFISQNRLNNLVIIVDSNKLCATDYLEHCCMVEPLKDKFLSFGFDVYSVDGNNVFSIIDTINLWKNKESRLPLSIIANTIKGKGISFMENNKKWHHGVPNDEEFIKIKKELKI